MNNNYQNIEVNEAVLMAYINGELLPKENKTVEHWLAKSEDNQNTFKNLKKTWEATEHLKPKPVAVNTGAAWEKILTKIDKSSEIPIQRKNSFLKIALGVAASIAVLFTVFNFWNQPIEKVQLTATNSVIEKTLLDGTAITINKNSKISYSKNFGKTERKIKLEGHAFFDVERDESKPFTIDLPKNTYVKVLGTSFNINTNDQNNTTTVFVKSGKVEFGNGAHKLILLANEKGIFSKNNGLLEKEDALKSEVSELYWIDEKLNFEGEKLGDIINTLSGIFKTDINLDCMEAANYPIVSDHHHESLDDILAVISLVHDLKIIKETISSKIVYSIKCND
ncbi:MAG: FecR family protein [Crocinitomicaceae bacterium]